MLWLIVTFISGNHMTWTAGTGNASSSDPTDPSDLPSTPGDDNFTVDLSPWLSSDAAAAPAPMRRQYGSPYYDHLYYDPSPINLNFKLVDNMKQLVYQAQRRLKDVQPILAPYVEDVHYRMSFIFSTLEAMKYDIQRMYTMQHRNLTQLFMFEHINHYEHAVRKDVDVTYTVEHIIDFHTRIMLGEQKKKEEKRKEQDYGA